MGGGQAGIVRRAAGIRQGEGAMGVGPAIGFVRVSQFRDDMGFKDEHQDRSAGRVRPSTRGASKSKSGTAYWARASPRVIWSPVSLR